MANIISADSGSVLGFAVAHPHLAGQFDGSFSPANDNNRLTARSLPNDFISQLVFATLGF